MTARSFQHLIPLHGEVHVRAAERAERERIRLTWIAGSGAAKVSSRWAAAARRSVSVRQPHCLPPSRCHLATPPKADAHQQLCGCPCGGRGPRVRIAASQNLAFYRFRPPAPPLHHRPMFEPVRGQPDFPALEASIAAWWREHGTYERSLERRRGAPRFVFFEGPPTANGMPHPGHCLTRTIKDLYPRYRTMRGQYCER